MLTTSEIAVTATIWVLTATGGFFGTRAAVRKKSLKCEDIKNRVSRPAGGLTDLRTAESDAEWNTGRKKLLLSGMRRAK